MQRWQLTFSLAGLTALAAFLVPSLHAPPTQPPPAASDLGAGDPAMGDLGAGDPAEPSGAAAASDGLLDVHAALDQSALLLDSSASRYLVIEVQAPQLPGDVRRPVNLAVVMDTSGSMAGQGKIAKARMAAAELVDQLQPTDTLSLVSFNEHGRVIVESTPATDRARLRRMIDQIRPGGGTNLGEGLQLGLDQLQRPGLEGVRRVVLLSDGEANIGVTDTATLARLAGSRVGQGVTVSALGLGLDYNEDLLSKMSDAGGGAYHFVDQPGQLAAMFEEELNQVSRLAGRGTTVDLTLPAGVHLEEIYGWSASRTLDGFRVFLGDVHGGETRKIVARVRIDGDRPGERPVADVHLRYTDADTGRSTDEAVALRARVTDDSALVSSSFDKDARIAAARAHVGKLLDESARKYGQGDVEANQARLREAWGLLADMRRRYDAPELERDAKLIQQQAAAFSASAPTSDAGRFQVKKAKEVARAYAR